MNIHSPFLSLFPETGRVQKSRRYIQGEVWLKMSITVKLGDPIVIF